MSYQSMNVKKEGRIATVTFCAPSKRNALTPRFLEEYASLLGELEEDSEISVVILTGTGKVFIAGADISAMADMDAQTAAQYAYNTTKLYQAMEASGKIYIAAVNGYALGGGCELALACDLRVASPMARFGLPETGLGIIPGGGGTQRLPRLIGMARAKELVYTGKIIDAEKAARVGLIDQVTQPDTLLEEAKALAELVLKNSRYAVGLSKQALNAGIQRELTLAIDMEREIFAQCFDHPDQKEGMRAFLEKRHPRFS